MMDDDHKETCAIFKGLKCNCGGDFSGTLNSLVGECPYCDGERRTVCECGANTHCSKCGRGGGKSPCACRPAKPRDGELRWG